MPPIARLLSTLVVFVSLIASAVASDVPSDEVGFTAYMVGLFKRELAGADVTSSAPLTLDITTPGPNGHGSQILNLAAVYRLCRLHPDACDRIAAGHVQDMAGYYAHLEEAPDRAALRVAIRPRAYVDLMRSRSRDGTIAALPLAGHLWAVAVIDLPTIMRAVKDSDLDAMHVSPADAIDTGRTNTQRDLATSIAELKRAAKTGRDMMGFAGNPYMASLLAFKDIWPGIATSMQGHLIVTAPAYDLLIVGHDEGPDAVSALRDAGRDAARNALHPLSNDVFRWSDGGWEVAAP